MKKLALTFGLLVTVCFVSVSQRRLQIVSDPMLSGFDIHVVENSVYAAEYYGTTLRKYDGSRSVIPYPLEGGVPLQYDYYNSKSSLSFNGSLYLVLNGTNRFLYRYNDAGFYRVPLELFSNIVIYRNKVYALARRPGGAIGLFSYDGSMLREEVARMSVSSYTHNLKAGGGYLYIQGVWSDEGPFYVWQFTGSAVRLLSGLRDSRIEEIFSVRGTDDAYFKYESDEIDFYDGTRFNSTAPTPEERIERWGVMLSGNTLYFQEDDGFGPFKLMRCVDGSCSEIPVSVGSLIEGALSAVYDGALYVPIRVGGSDFIYRYDGATFTRFFDFPETTFNPILRVREGKLLIQSGANEADTAWEYNGTDFISIRSPEGERIRKSGESAICYHTWMLHYRDKTIPAPHHQWVLAIEVPDSTCTPPGSSVVIIPERLREYERFGIGHYARERDWCWTGIDIDWIDPICQILPCEPSKTESALLDANGENVWSKVFDKPFSTSFSVDDKPYASSVAVGNGKTFDRVLLMDQDLVHNGIETVSFDMFPKEGYIYLKVDTRKQQQVPISLTLRNTKGESLWQQEFTAPMNEFIRAYTSKPGAYLQVSLQQQQTSGVLYFPNPFKENLTIEVAEGTPPVSISLSDLNGKVMFQTKIPGPGKHSINVGSQKSGLYILTIVEGELTRRELVQIE